MQEIIKNLISQIPIIILVIILMWMFQGNQLNYKDVMEQMNQRDSIISQVIDDQGRLITTHTNRQYSPYVINNSNSPEMIELRKELKAINIRVEDLTSAVIINTKASGSGTTDIIKTTDTLKGIETYAFSDTTGKHLKLSGVIDLINNKLSYEYTYAATYSLFSYEYRKKFWKRPEMQIKLISDDPSNKVQMQTYTIKPPRDIVSLGIGVGAAVYYGNGQFGVAPAITIGFYKSIYTFRTKN